MRDETHVSTRESRISILNSRMGTNSTFHREHFSEVNEIIFLDGDELRVWLHLWNLHWIVPHFYVGAHWIFHHIFQNAIHFFLIWCLVVLYWRSFYCVFFLIYGGKSTIWETTVETMVIKEKYKHDVPSQTLNFITHFFYGMDCQLPIANCRSLTANCRLLITDCQ